jgi:hypothetical protein
MPSLAVCTTNSYLLCMPSLNIMLLTCRVQVFGEMPKLHAASLIGLPCAKRYRTSSSRFVKLGLIPPLQKLNLFFIVLAPLMVGDSTDIEIHDDGQRNAGARANCQANFGYILCGTQVVGRKPEKTAKWGICTIDSLLKGAVRGWAADDRRTTDRP